MKKRTIVLGMIFIVAGALAACGNSEDNAASNETQAQVSQEASTAKKENETAKNTKSGLGITTRVSESKGAEEEDGLVQTDMTVAAVTVDENGKILSCTIDEVQAKVNFDDDGTITTDLNVQIPTKQELGDTYGMKAASSIQKEWKEQAEAFAQYCVGKTVDEIKDIAVTEEGKPAEEDLAASCTVYVGNFVDTVVKAVENVK